MTTSMRKITNTVHMDGVIYVRKCTVHGKLIWNDNIWLKCKHKISPISWFISVTKHIIITII